MAVAAYIFLALFITYFVFRAFNQAIYMNTYAANGTFQLFNPLRRMLDGQIVGVDFPFFHGIGVPFLHYPIFELFGRNLFAAELSKWLVSPVMFLSSAFIFCYAYFKNLKITGIATALVIIISVFCIELVYPSNSLQGIRSTFPVLVAAALLWNSRRTTSIFGLKIQNSELIASILLAIAFVCGTEQGLAAIVAFTVVKIFILIKNRHRIKKQLLSLGLLLGITGITTLLLLTILSQGNPLAPLHYALIDIPTDQGWYFGASPNDYLRWDNILPQFFNPISMTYFHCTLAAVILFIYLGVRRNALSSVQKAAFGFAILYGLVVFAVATIGYYNPQGQTLPLFRILILLAVVLFVQFMFSNVLWKSKENHIIRKLAIVATIGLSSLIMIFSIIQHYKDIDRMRLKDIVLTAHRATQSDDYYSSNPDWKERIDSFRPYIKEGAKIWPLYAGVYESELSKTLGMSSGGEDYIIHALGKERRTAYEKEFIEKKPELVTTIRPTYFVYDEWLMNSHWRIYEQLLSNYEIIAKNDAHYLWKIREAQAPKNETKKATLQDSSFTLPRNETDAPQVYSITINYETDPGVPITALNRIPRYMMYIQNNGYQRYPVTLPPNETTWSFPVVVPPNSDGITLTWGAQGILPSASLNISSATFRSIEVQSENRELLEDNFRLIHGIRE